MPARKSIFDRCSEASAWSMAGEARDALPVELKHRDQHRQQVMQTPFQKADAPRFRLDASTCLLAPDGLPYPQGSPWTLFRRLTARLKHDVRKHTDCFARLSRTWSQGMPAAALAPPTFCNTCIDHRLNIGRRSIVPRHKRWALNDQNTVQPLCALLKHQHSRAKLRLSQSYRALTIIKRHCYPYPDPILVA